MTRRQDDEQSPRPRVAVFWPALALLLTAICGGCVFAAPQRISRSTDAGDAARFFYGLGGQEQNESGSFRWSGRAWGVALFGAAYTAPTLVTIHASATRPAGEQEAALRLVGTPATAVFAMSREPRRYRLLARPTSDANGRQQIDFIGTVFTPDGADGRALGIAISRIDLAQLGAAALLPVVARSLFFAGIALALAIAVRQLGALRLIAVSIGSVAALALGGLHVYSTQTLGFLLPNAWLLLGGVCAALLVLPMRRAIAAQGTTDNRRQTKGQTAICRLSSVVRRPSSLATFRPSSVVLRPVFASGVAFLGTLALWLHPLPVALGLTLAIGGALLAVIALPATTSAAPSLKITGRQTALLLTLITLVALAVRLYKLNEQPIALWRDEVYHAELAQRIWRDASFRPVYVPEVDLPALLFYLIAPPIGLFGADLWTLRLVPALAGALTPLALWFALRPIFGQRVALIAALCMAVSAWSLYMSRWTFPVILDPLFTLLAIGCLVRGVGGRHGDKAMRRQGDSISFIRSPSHPVTRSLFCILGGFFAGLVVYTYHTGRIEPVAIGLVVWLGVLGKASAENQRTTDNGQRTTDTTPRITRSPVHLVTLSLVIFLLTLAPLASFALTNPDAFSKRFGAVSVFNGPDTAPTAPLTVLDDQVGRHALMWNVRGDQNSRHYAAFRPMLDPFSGVLLLIGLGVCLLRRRDLAGWALLAWLAIGLVPGIFSDVAPHAMRTIGALAPTCALVALGLEALIRSLFQHQGAKAPRTTQLLSFGALRLRGKRALISVALLTCIAAWNIGLYFTVSGDLRENYYAFETQRTLFARAARTFTQAHPEASVYMPNVLREGKAGQTTTLLLGAAPIGWLTGATLDPPPSGTALLLLNGDSDAMQQATALQSLGPAARLLRTGPPIPFQTVPIYLVYGTGELAQQLADGLELP